MNDEKNTLSLAFDSAVEKKSFNKAHIALRARNVCVFGLGRYFDEAFLRQNVRERFHVNILCDNNRKRLEEIENDPAYRGLRCVTPESLKDIEDLVVILMLGDPESAIDQLSGIVCGGSLNCIAYNDLMLDYNVSLDQDDSMYASQKDRMLEAYELMSDEHSKHVFKEVFCLRFAPEFAEGRYKDICELPQYYPDDLFRLSPNECIVDCGAYTGDTLESFADFTEGSFGSYDAYELDKTNYEALLDTAAKLKAAVRGDIRCHNYGVFSENRDISYGRDSASESYSIYNESDTEKARVVRLDDHIKTYLPKDNITFLKMDIEGAEMNALKGAEHIIQEQHPKLAICVYHRPEDLWNIPLYINALNPEYHLYMRHHATCYVAETVCYAIP